MAMKNRRAQPTSLILIAEMKKLKEQREYLLRRLMAHLAFSASDAPNPCSDRASEVPESAHSHVLKTRAIF